MIDLSQMKADELEQLKATIDAEVESRHSKLMDELDELLKNIKQLRMKHLRQLLIEHTRQDGTVEKTAVFRHSGWVGLEFAEPE